MAKTQEFEVEGFVGRLEDYSDLGYLLVFPGKKVIYVSGRDLASPLGFNPLGREANGDLAFSLFLKPRDFSFISDTKLRRVLETMIEEREKDVHWTERTYRFLYRGQKENRFAPPIAQYPNEKECELYVITTDKSDIREGDRKIPNLAYTPS